MTFIRTVPPADATGDVHAMYARQQDFWGYVPNYARAMSGRPEVLKRWGRLLAEIRRPMPDDRFELVTFAAALALRNSACALQHGKLLAGFIGEDAVLALRAGRYADGIAPREQAIFELARQVATDASRVTRGEVERLQVFGLTDDEVFDIVAAAAGRAFFTKLLDGLGVEADAAFLELDAPFRQSLTVGRPVDFRPGQRLP